MHFYGISLNYINKSGSRLDETKSSQFSLKDSVMVLITAQGGMLKKLYIDNSLYLILMSWRNHLTWLGYNDNCVQGWDLKIQWREKIFFLQFLLPIDGGKTDQRSRGPLINTSHCISAAPTDMSVSGIVYSVIRSPAIMCQKCSAACRYISITLAVPVMGTFFPLGLTPRLLHVKCFGQVVLRDLPQALAENYWADIPSNQTWGFRFVEHSKPFSPEKVTKDESWKF